MPQTLLLSTTDRNCRPILAQISATVGKRVHHRHSTGTYILLAPFEFCGRIFGLWSTIRKSPIPLPHLLYLHIIDKKWSQKTKDPRLVAPLAMTARRSNHFTISPIKWIILAESLYKIKPYFLWVGEGGLLWWFYDFLPAYFLLRFLIIHFWFASMNLLY
jgi:hypothetical protein